MSGKGEKNVNLLMTHTVFMTQLQYFIYRIHIIMIPFIYYSDIIINSSNHVILISSTFYIIFNSESYEYFINNHMILK